MPAIKHFNYIVIGGGSGGVASSRRAASYGAKVLLIESKKIGGTCVNVGCVPKKIMWYASDMASKIGLASDYGFKKVAPELNSFFDWPGFVAKRNAYVKRLNGIYERNLDKEGVQLVYGTASFTKNGEVEVKDFDGNVTVYKGDKILVATGGKPVWPSSIPGYEHGIDSDGFFALETQPKRVAVVGAGYIGVEFAGVLHGLGSETHLVIRKSTVLRKFDDIIGSTITECYEQNGVKVHKNSNVSKVVKNASGELEVSFDTGKSIVVDCLIWTIGRKSLIDIHPENIGLELNDRGQVVVDEYQATNVANVFSLGDVVGNVELTPVAIAAGRKLSNRLFGPEIYANDKQDYANVPSVIFSHPEAGSIGLSETEAVEKYGKDSIKVYKTRFNAMYYGMSEHKSPTVYKLVCEGENEKVVGLHLVGDSSSEILQGFGVAIKMGATKKDFDSCVAIHPTSAEEIVTLR